MVQGINDAKELLRTGKFNDAVHLLQSLANENPGNVEVLFYLGRACLDSGDHEGACKHFKAALNHDPENASISNALGVTLFQMNELDESEAVLKKAIDGNPDNIEVLGNLGLVLIHTGKHDEALKTLQSVVRGGGATVKIMEELGKELVRHNLHARSRKLFNSLHKSQPENPVANTYLGNFFAMEGNTEKANDHWDRAKQTAPNHAGPYIGAAIGYLKQGNKPESIRCLETALDIDKGNAEASFLWAHTVDGDSQAKINREDVLAAIKTELEREDLAYDDWNNLMFAAGKLSAAQQDHEAAFDFYHRANKRIWTRQSMASNSYEKRTDAILSVFNPIFFVKNKEIIERPQKGDDKCGEGLIFIFGMPRSGTTLIEQIIALNEDVCPGGESEHVSGLISRLGDVLGRHADFPQSVQGLQMDDVRKIAGDFHAMIDRASQNAPFFTDKSLENFMYLGIMAVLFPRAKFIHANRNPVDTCLSSYFSFFVYNSLKYTYDLAVLGKVYVQYERIMEAWHKVLPVQIHDVVYEEITENPRTAIRELVTFCDIEWDEKYLSPQKGKRDVHTASVNQVRKPIHTGSIGRWKPYEAHLGPLLDALNHAESS